MCSSPSPTAAHLGLHSLISVMCTQKGDSSSTCKNRVRVPHSNGKYNPLDTNCWPNLRLRLAPAAPTLLSEPHDSTGESPWQSFFAAFSLFFLVKQNKLGVEKGMPLAKVLQNWEKIYGTAQLSKKHTVALCQEEWPYITRTAGGGPGKSGHYIGLSIN